MSNTPFTHLLLFAVLILAFTVALPCEASNKEQETQLREIREQIRKITKTLHDSEKERNSVQSQLHEIEVRLAESNQGIRGLNQKITHTQKSLSNLRKQQTNLDSERIQQREQLALQIRAAYINGHQEHLKLLLNQEDPAVLSRVMVYYHYLNQERINVIDKAEKTLTELAVLEKSIVLQSQELLRLQAQLEKSRLKIQQEHQQRNQVLASINQSIQTQDQAIAKLKTDERRIQQLLQSLTNVLSDIPRAKQAYVPFHTLKGKMDWPTHGSISNRFGETRNTGDLLWRGISIKAVSGSDVLAITHGRVAFADWLQGFGLLVILDHQDGYMSLYAHNQTLLKETGDWVESGELIASVGNSGGQENSALYFEIRHQGIPIDPSIWCRSTHLAQIKR